MSSNYQYYNNQNYSNNNYSNNNYSNNNYLNKNNYNNNNKYNNKSHQSYNNNNSNNNYSYQSNGHYQNNNHKKNDTNNKYNQDKTINGHKNDKSFPRMSSMKKFKSKLLLESKDYSNQKKPNNKDISQDLIEERIDLIECKSEIDFDQSELVRQITKDQRKMEKISHEIRPAAKRNFELEKNLAIIDKQIQLLIQNIININQLDELAGGVFTEKKENTTKSPLRGKKKNYEKLFHILQKDPRYFSVLATQVQSKDVSDFVKTVVFDMYGSQYDNREERLLLTLFQLVLQNSFDNAPDIGSFMRSNTAITQMLSAYAKRGQGLGILKEILEKPIREMVQQNSLNLEINPVEVYRQIINSYEAKMNKPWDGVRNPTSEEAAENKYVKRLIPPRVKQLEYIAEHFLSRIIETVDTIPFGIRWICRQLAEMAQKRFPEADRYQIGGLVGGYIYLRFFNPVIVTPESVHFVDKKLTKTMRRNLILVAKILQNLSNGVQFRDKYMKTISNWIERHREDIQTYFARLIDVENLQDRMDIDNLLQHTKKRDYTIQISFNQIFLIHRLLLKHRSLWNPNKDPNDPVLKILASLGGAPAAVKHKNNHIINLRLSGGEDDTFDEDKETENLQLRIREFFESMQCKDKFILSIRDKLKSLILDKSIPEIFMHQYTNSLKAWLYHVRDWASNHGNMKVLQDSSKVISGINKHSIESGGKEDDSKAFNNFLLIYMNEIRDMKRKTDRFHLKVDAVCKARDTITDHANYLGTKLEYYRQYLENVKYKGGGMDKKNKKDKKNQKKNQKKKPVRFTHKQLLNSNVIVDVDEEILQQTKANFNNLLYYFSQIGPDEFEVEVKYRVGFGAKISPFPEPFQLSLSKLLEMRDCNQSRYQLEMVTLQVNLLINLLNKHFIKENN